MINEVERLHALAEHLDGEIDSWGYPVSSITLCILTEH